MTKEYMVYLDSNDFILLQRVTIEIIELKNLIIFMLEHKMQEHPHYNKYNNELKQKLIDEQQLKIDFQNNYIKKLLKNSCEILTWNIDFNNGKLVYKVKED